MSHNPRHRLDLDVVSDDPELVGDEARVDAIVLRPVVHDVEVALLVDGHQGPPHVDLAGHHRVAILEPLDLGLGASLPVWTLERHHVSQVASRQLHKLVLGFLKLWRSPVFSDKGIFSFWFGYTVPVLSLFA